MPDLGLCLKRALRGKSLITDLLNLTEQLTTCEWRSLKQTSALDATSYGTSRVCRSDLEALRLVAARLPAGNTVDSLDNILIEVLTTDVAHAYVQQGIEFYSAEEINNSPAVTIISEGLEAIRYVPELYAAVFMLVRVVHLLKSVEGDEYDVSFSEPHLPFSIFVSAPSRRMSADHLRLAEAIVHEAMHLHLSLVEKITPMVINSDHQYYSPWKADYRPMRGVMHAIYVFRVLDHFFQRLMAQASLFPTERRHLESRVREIAEQVSEVKHFPDCQGLTLLGRNFARRLIEEVN